MEQKGGKGSALHVQLPSHECCHTRFSVTGPALTDTITPQCSGPWTQTESPDLLSWVTDRWWDFLASIIEWTNSNKVSLSFLKRFCLYVCLFLDRGKRREKEKERNINVQLPLVRPLLGTLATT